MVRAFLLRITIPYPSTPPVLYKLYVLFSIRNFASPSFPPSDLDRSNVNNAYVSGMKQDLNMQGNDFNVGAHLLMLP